MKDPHGAEQNGLAHISVIAKLSAGEGQVAPNMPPPKKRKHAHHDACPICTPTPAPELEYVLSTSPYAASIQRRKYTELDNGVCELFNRDWEFFPHLRFACAKILAGCLLLNNQNGQVVIANTIEVYGRTRLVDAHREPFIHKSFTGNKDIPGSGIIGRWSSACQRKRYMVRLEQQPHVAAATNKN
ncbi:hypothetical protein BGZ91_005312 [Linnemannia elongata]|nr:hypothetical protein BGZ91_005312 [Linnemannia elongata]